VSGETDQAPEIALLQENISLMEQRVERLRDREAIENLINIYGYYLDKALWDQVADLFAEDASIEISQRGVYVGKQSIRASLQLYGPQGLEHAHLHNHIQLQPVITIAPDGKTAWSRHRAFSQLGQHEGTAIWHGGGYENEYVNENGVWKFMKDHVYTTFFSNYGKGWVNGARGAAQPSDSIPPDLPATEFYEALPEVYLPAFHYRHPVTGREIKFPRQQDQ
jgi:hypothetical protein